MTDIENAQIKLSILLDLIQIFGKASIMLRSIINRNARQSLFEHRRLAGIETAKTAIQRSLEEVAESEEH
jgi:hypothetical protein